MTSAERDESVLRRMLAWCEQSEEAHVQFGRSQQTFIANSAYRNAVSMCIFQICELANHLTEDLKNAHPELPWNQIRGMRNLFAHDYGNMDMAGIWATSVQDIPEIERFCRNLIG